MRITALTVLLGTLCLAACDDTNNVVSIASRTDAFILQTVNGQALPVTIIDSISPPLRIDVLSGAISLTTTNGFTDVTTFRQTLDNVVTTPTVSCTGTVTRVGNVFTFVEAVAANCSRTFTGTLTGTTMSASVLGFPAVYTR